jgi:hypothetical protein
LWALWSNGPRTTKAAEALVPAFGIVAGLVLAGSEAKVADQFLGGGETVNVVDHRHQGEGHPVPDAHQTPKAGPPGVGGEFAHHHFLQLFAAGLDFPQLYELPGEQIGLERRPRFCRERGLQSVVPYRFVLV